MPGTKRTFIITSVIYFSGKKIYGAVKRSLFSPAERTEQTIKTVASIREKVPGATIVLLELGREKNIASELRNRIDSYVFAGDRALVKWAVNGKHRGLGEAMGLIVSNKELSGDADFYFKISGRYFLDNHFDPALWEGDSLLARKYGKGISTRLYGFAKELYPRWQNALKRSLPALYLGKSIEDVFPVKFGVERIKEIKRLGLAGYVGPYGEYLEE
jgi:hypothetical protein